jgi:hypothetical protein
MPVLIHAVPSLDRTVAALHLKLPLATALKDALQMGWWPEKDSLG